MSECVDSNSDRLSEKEKDVEGEGIREMYEMRDKQNMCCERQCVLMLSQNYCLCVYVRVKYYLCMCVCVRERDSYSE